MIVDARTVPDGETLETDVCVIGAGPAGLTLARAWANESFGVCLLEGGGFEPDEATLSLAKGESIGVPYDRLEGARFRAFGGNSHTWYLDIGGGRAGTRLRALDPVDFERRDWIPYSGWPFDRAHLEPYYERAHRLLRLGPVEYEAEPWEDPPARARLPLDPARIETTIFQFARADLFFDESRDVVHRSSNITAYLHANVTRLETDETGTVVERARVACLPGATSVLMPSEDGFQRMPVEPLPASAFSVKARIFILAAGGTENPRLLLLSDDIQPGGIGNGNDLVGRFFMEHPHIWSGWFVPSDPALASRMSLYGIHSSRGVPVMGKLTLSEEVLRRERLLGYCVSFLPRERKPLAGSVRSLATLARSLRRGRLPRRAGHHAKNVVSGLGEIARKVVSKLSGRPGGDRAEAGRGDGVLAFRLDNMAEQAPNPDSRVTLSSERDALGLPRVRLDWRLRPDDIRSMVRAQEIVDAELRRAGLGRLQIELEGPTPPPGLKGGWHHMGTTRMHTDPREGVVDDHCRVHGVANLYIAGSSVFPTGGYANPTLTICALAFRLADRVKKRFRGPD